MKFKNKEMPLPSNRFEMLRDILKYRLFDIILLSIYMFLFMLPSILWTIFGGYLFSNVETHSIYEVILINGINIIFIMIFGLGSAGSFYVLKKICFQEGESINHDFIVGIKKNWKMFLLIYFFIGLIYFLLEVGIATISSYESLDGITIGAIQGIMYGIFIIFMMIFFFMQTQTIIYVANFTQLFINGVKFTFGMFLKNIGIFFILLLPLFIFELVPSIGGIDYFQYTMIILEAVFYFGFSFCIFSLYSNHVFDLSLNKEYSELYRKGLVKENNKS